MRRALATALIALVATVAALAPAGGTASALGAQDPAPTTTAPVDDGLRYDKITGPRYEDSSPTRAVMLPLGVAGVAIFTVVVVLVVRSRRTTQARHAQLREGSGGQ